MEQAFDVRDSRAVLRPVAERMGASAAAPDATSPAVVVFAPDDIDLDDYPLETSGRCRGSGGAETCARGAPHRGRRGTPGDRCDHGQPGGTGAHAPGRRGGRSASETRGTSERHGSRCS